MKNKITIRNLLLISIAALLSGGAFAVWKNLSSRTPEELVKSLPGNIDIAFGDVDYTETRGAEQFWRLQADSVAREANRQEVQLENVRMTFYDQEDYGDIHLTARKGRWFSETGNVELVGDVVVKSDQGQALFCQQLFYDNQAELITSESPVRLVAEDMETTGQGFEVLLSQKRFVILSQVQTRLSGW